jgi:hypothetical protein
MTGLISQLRGRPHEIGAGTIVRIGIIRVLTLASISAINHPINHEGNYGAFNPEAGSKPGFGLDVLLLSTQNAPCV